MIRTRRELPKMLLLLSGVHASRHKVFVWSHSNELVQRDSTGSFAFRKRLVSPRSKTVFADLQTRNF
jgi:hypothetical protein